MAESTGPRLKLLKGTLRKPKRTRSKPARDHAGIGDPPSYLTVAQRRVWRELARSLVPHSAAYSDRPAFELLVRMVAKLREPGSNPSPSFYAQLRGLMAAFALTPLDRQRLDPPSLAANAPLDDDDDISEFFR
jgi:hypothetical protein